MLIVNLNQNKSNINYYISSTLLENIENNLKLNKKIILYLNKRWSFSSLICEDCQYYYKCKNCDVSLTVHEREWKLACHLCWASWNTPLSCSKCNWNHLKKIWVWTQQIEDSLRSYFKSPHSVSPIGREAATELWNKKDMILDQKEYSPRYIVELSKKLRKTQTKAKEFLWEILRNRKFNNLKFRRQHPFWRYIADFYCKEINLVIELDWEIHKKTQEYDKIRDEIIEKYNVKILRFQNNDVFNDLKKILKDIREHIPLPMGEARWWQEKVNIFRFDLDSIKNKTEKQKALNNLEEANIIIATKMITTGFDFKNIWLIWIILAEQEFSFPSYNSEEKAYINLKQLIWRWNRLWEKTEIILQTFIPDNEIIKSLSEKNYKTFFIDTLQERKLFNYPPFTEMLTLEYRYKSEQKAYDFMLNLKNKLDLLNTNDFNIEIILNKQSFKKYNQYFIKIILKWDNLRDFILNIKSEIFRNSNLSVIFE